MGEWEEAREAGVGGGHSEEWAERGGRHAWWGCVWVGSGLRVEEVVAGVVGMWRS